MMLCNTLCLVLSAALMIIHPYICKDGRKRLINSTGVTGGKFDKLYLLRTPLN
jgi:hypothetical protein